MFDFSELLKVTPANITRAKTCAIDFPGCGQNINDGPWLEIFERAGVIEHAPLERRACGVQHVSEVPSAWSIYMLWPVTLNYDRDVTISKIVLHMPNWTMPEGMDMASQELWAKSLPMDVPAGINFVLP